MSSTGKNRFRSFLGDGRGDLYVHSCYHGDDFTHAYNANAPKDIIGSIAWEIMRAELYENKGSARDNDIHWEFTDFVVKAALLHRAIDQPTNRGVVNSTIRNALQNYNVDTSAIVNAVPLTRENYVDANGVTHIGLNRSPNEWPGWNAMVTNQKNLVLARLPAGTSDDTKNAISSAIDQYFSNQASMIRATGIAETYRFDNNSFRDAIIPASSESDRNYMTLQTSPEAQQIWRDVYQKWGELDDREKKFYKQNIVVMKKVGNSWMKVDEADYTTQNVNLNDYRLNLAKPNEGSENTIFGNALPRLPVSEVNSIWYTDATGAHQYVPSVSNWEETTGSNFFPNLYKHIYKNGGGNVSVSVGSNNNVSLNVTSNWKDNDLPYFNIKVDKLIRKRLMSLKTAKQVSPVTENEEVFNFTDRNIWYRDANGVFVKKVDGQTVKYGDQDQTTADTLKADFKCYSTLVKAKDTQQCRKYVYNCLVEGDSDGLKKCMTFLKDSPADFFDVAKQEIGQMHPMVALKTLQKFGFRVHTEYDGESGMSLKKIERVNHWLKNFMTEKFKEKDVQDAIKSNDRLLAYLDLIAQYVNSNPGLLNPGFGGKTEEMVGKYTPSGYINKLGIKMRKEPSREFSGLVDIGRLRSHLRTSMYGATSGRPQQGLFGLQQSPMRSPYGGTSFGMMMPMAMQAGGHYPSAMDLVTKRLNGKEYACTGSQLLRSVAASLVDNMKKYGKQLDEGEKTKIIQKINNLAKSEDELITTLRYIEEYTMLMEYFKDYKAKTLSLSSLESLVKHHSNLLTRHNKEEGSVATILQALQKVVACKDGDAEEEEDYEELQF